MATLMRRDPDAPPLRIANMDRLENLAGCLARRGLRADVMAPPGRIPRLQAANPATGMAEEVYAWRCQDGAWWYWWPWAERIAAGEDLAVAAERIMQALTPVPVS